MKKKLLGEKLIEKRIITREGLERALEEQKRSGDFITNCIIKLGLATEDHLIPILAEELNVQYIMVKDRDVPPDVIKMVPAKIAHYYEIIPIAFAAGMLDIAINDPFDTNKLDEIKLLLNCDIRPFLSAKKDILEGLKRYYGLGAETVETMIRESESSISIDIPSPEVQDIGTSAEDASVIKFVNQILMEAYNDRASDIHIEPFQDELIIRYRIDGILHNIAIPPNIKQFQSAMVSRIKIMANLNIAERRLPQDGRIKIKAQDKELDLRVSILPTPFGETVSIRLLSGSSEFIGLDSLGFSESDLATLRHTIAKPHGIVLLTGPTGSGKSTTLYAFLSELNKAEKKILTIEDPIEYQLKGITQMQVHPKINFTFAAGLRSMLRHDPDIMMVGEIRDSETAEITIRAALTGHLVFSTLHTNDAAGAFSRLIDMGIEPYLVSSSAECVIAQRLVRILCGHCKTKINPENAVLEEIRHASGNNGVEIFQPTGCRKCKGTGYWGRTALHEILIVDDDIRSLIVQRTPAHIIRDKAVQKGMKTLRENGWLKVGRGTTSIDEVLRVTQETEALE